jgi:hypothetical protein
VIFLSSSMSRMAVGLIHLPGGGMGLGKWLYF